MDEKYTKCEDRISVAKAFSEVCRSSGKTMFPVTYTVTEGNLQIDKDFQEFCFKYANNEYLAGISLLLNIAKHYEDIKGLEDYMSQIDGRLMLIEEQLKGANDGVQKEEVKKDKTKTF
jgi:hypothetical protein